MSKRLGIVPHLYARPLFDGLRSRRDADAPQFVLVEEHFAQLAVQLREGKLDGAFLSPVEYAREYPHYRILPGAGVVSEGESGSVILVFNEKARTVKTIAVDPAFPSEIVLANIIMKEKYDTVPQIIPTSRSLQEALNKADAVLAVDRTALMARDRRNKIDLVDEWLDLTELPFVHGVWTVREGALTIEEINTLISATQAAGLSYETDSDEREYLVNFRYTLDERAVASLHEFFRMAYYHGILKDIPDVRMHNPERAMTRQTKSHT